MSERRPQPSRAIASRYGALGAAFAVAGGGAISRGLAFGLVLWAVTIVPLLLEVALFVNWHRGFVPGLLLDWLVVCALASTCAAIAAGMA